MARLHPRRKIAFVLVTFLGIVVLTVGGVATLAGAGDVNEHPGCQAGETEYQHLEGSSSNADISWVIDGTSATVTALNESPLIMQIAVKSGGGPTVDDGLFSFRPDGSDAETVLSQSFDQNEQRQDVSFIDVCVGAPPAPTIVEEPTTTTTAAGGVTVEEEEAEEEEAEEEEAEVLGVTVEPETPRAAPEELAFTGVGDWLAPLAALGVFLVGAGAVIAWTGRRRVPVTIDEQE